jgi:hypothetical protein
MSGDLAKHGSPRKSSFDRKFAMSTTQTDISTEEIARRAYELWQRRGCPGGDGSEDWEAALAQLTAERRGRHENSGGLLTWFTRVRRSVQRRDAS